MQPEVRWATPADLDAWDARHPREYPRPTVTAMVGVLDGEIIAVGGVIHLNGQRFAFYELDEKARRYRVTLVKAAKRVMAHVARSGAVIFAVADPAEPGAKRWIASLGFVPHDVPGLYVYRG